MVGSVFDHRLLANKFSPSLLELSRCQRAGIAQFAQSRKLLAVRGGQPVLRIDDFLRRHALHLGAGPLCLRHPLGGLLALNAGEGEFLEGGLGVPDALQFGF